MQCALCRMRDADEVGSHLAPNFIIHSAFSYDGKGKRDHEISYFTSINDSSRPAFYGRDVNPEAIEADLGHEMTEEESEENVNILVYDHLFCKDCEKWFSMLENAYSEMYTKGKDINPRVAYLFWLSVFWRMSVGYMSILMDIHDELKIREILQNCLSMDRSAIEKSTMDLGDYGYVIWKTDGIQKGDSGIFGTRARHCPYIIILNDLIVALVKDDGSKHKIGYKTVPTENVNSWKDDDIYIGSLSLEEFARMKRWMIDESKYNGYGNERLALDQNYQEIWRSKGEIIDWETYLEEERYARYQDGIYEMKDLRNVYRFWAAEIKWHACKRKGIDYKLLQDRSLFLFQFDIDNYRNDLMKFYKRGEDISALPYAARIVSKKYIDNDKRRTLDEICEEIIEDALKRGFSLEDIIERNCCRKEN